MSKREQPNKNFKPAKQEVPFEKFRKQKPADSQLHQAAGRAMKARVRSFNKKEDETPVERWINDKQPRERKRLYIPQEAEKVDDDNMRLNKYLAHSGVASRRKADELIKAGKVTVNGIVVTEMGYRLQPIDQVRFDGKLLNPESKVYILLNKPKDFITTTSDERERKTVMELIRGAYDKIKSAKKPRLYPVGRLDRNTTGVLLITNDGTLTQQLVHPSTEIRKVYHVFLDKKLKDSDFLKIAEGGVVLEDGIVEVDEIAFPNPKTKSEVGIEIHSGKNRVVRRIFEALGYEVIKLDRVFFAGLTKKDLPRGRWRFLSEQEVRMLKHFTLGKQEQTEKPKEKAKVQPAEKPKPKEEKNALPKEKVKKEIKKKAPVKKSSIKRSKPAKN
jgi:23S rRNA pseudouridine2605 synthase